MQIKPPKKEVEIEKAIVFLVSCVNKKCLNPKPLILHSIRVGIKLLELKQSKEVVIAGILHDLIEDTNCTTKEVENLFGSKVAGLVKACTHANIKDYKLRWHQSIVNIRKAGEGAMLIKIIDCNDNLPYVLLVKNIKIVKEILWKQRLVIKSFELEIGDTETFKDYFNNYKALLRKLEIFYKGVLKIKNE